MINGALIVIASFAIIIGQNIWHWPSTKKCYRGHNIKKDNIKIGVTYDNLVKTIGPSFLLADKNTVYWMYETWEENFLGRKKNKISKIIIARLKDGKVVQVDERDVKYFTPDPHHEPDPTQHGNLLHEFAKSFVLNSFI
jgi:hypothetical protein